MQLSSSQVLCVQRKNFDCFSNDCDNCPGKEFVNRIIKVLDTVDSITYSQWMKNDSFFQKVQIHESGQSVAEQFFILTREQIKLHI